LEDCVPYTYSLGSIKTNEILNFMLEKNKTYLKLNNATNKFTTFDETLQRDLINKLKWNVDTI